MNLPPNAASDGGNGVIHTGLLNIRRMALREKQSIREISRRTGLSRDTIAQYLNAGTIEPTFTVGVCERSHRTRFQCDLEGVACTAGSADE